MEVCDESFFWGSSEQAILDQVVSRFDEAGVDLTWSLTDCTYERSLVAQYDTYGSLRHWIWDHDATGEPVALPPKILALHHGDPFWTKQGPNGLDASVHPVLWKINPYGPGGAHTIASWAMFLNATTRVPSTDAPSRLMNEGFTSRLPAPGVSPQKAMYPLQSILIHELMHVLGAGHVAADAFGTGRERDTCMLEGWTYQICSESGIDPYFDTVNRGTEVRLPFADREFVALNYGLGDSVYPDAPELLPWQLTELTVGDPAASTHAWFGGFGRAAGSSPDPASKPVVMNMCPGGDAGAVLNHLTAVGLPRVAIPPDNPAGLRLDLTVLCPRDPTVSPVVGSWTVSKTGEGHMFHPGSATYSVAYGQLIPDFDVDVDCEDHPWVQLFDLRGPQSEPITLPVHFTTKGCL